MLSKLVKLLLEKINNSLLQGSIQNKVFTNHILAENMHIFLESQRLNRTQEYGLKSFNKKNYWTMSYFWKHSYP